MLFLPPDAPRLAAALEAVNRDEAGAAGALAGAVAADEPVWVPTGDDGRHPLAQDGPSGRFLTAFSGVGLAQWAHPWRPPLVDRPLREVLGWVLRSGVPLHLDHGSEADTRIDAADAAALLEGRVADPARLAAGRPYRRPGPPATVPTAPLPAPPTNPDDPGVAYGRSWDASRRRVVDPLSSAAAATLHEASEPYVAVRTGDGGGDGGDGEVRVVTTGPLHVEARVEPAAAGPHRRLVWWRFSEGLFLQEVALGVPGGAGPGFELVVLARPDGLVVVWAAEGREDAGRSLRYAPDLSDRWIGRPGPGVPAVLFDEAVTNSR